MYTEAELYDLLYASGIDGRDYSAEAGQIADLVRRVRPHSRTQFDVACGTAEDARYLSEVHGFEVDGIDLSPRDDREVSRQVPPPPVRRRRHGQGEPMTRARSVIGLGAFFVVLFVASAALSACKKSSRDDTVSVLYAGSLATAMENGLGATFSKATGHAYKGEAQGSLGGARMIHDGLRSPDVFISADPTVNETVLMGDKNKNLVSWFATMASSQLVLAYNPKSAFADKFQAAATNAIPWYEVLQLPGVRFGRGDPTTDPKGYRTLFLFDLAGKHYKKPEIPRMLGEPLNPAQVFPEIVLLARVETGQFDAGIFYRHEVVAHHLPFVTFPPEINLGYPEFATSYATASYQLPSGETVHGAPILFTLTIPRTVTHPAAAEAFVRFMLTSPKLLEGFGFGIIEHQVGGDREQVPADLRGLCPGTYKP